MFHTVFRTGLVLYLPDPCVCVEFPLFFRFISRPSRSHLRTAQIGERLAQHGDDMDLVIHGQQLSAPRICVAISTLPTDFHSSERGADTSSVRGGSSGCTMYRAIYTWCSADYRLTIHTPHHLLYHTHRSASRFPVLHFLYISRSVSNPDPIP